MHTKTLKTGIRVQRYFIYLAYDGTNYHGWQIQPNGISVQECLMKALSTFLRCEIEVVGAGRTDAGVHASLMVAHFDYDGLLDTVSVAEKYADIIIRIAITTINIRALSSIFTSLHFF